MCLFVYSLKISQKHADELEKALKEANAKVSAAEDKLLERESEMATREADIHQRLDKLNSSFTSKIEFLLSHVTYTDIGDVGNPQFFQ